MKKLLTVCMLAFGAVAFAGTGNTTEAENTDKNVVEVTVAKKATAKTTIAEEPKKPKPVPTRAVCTTCSNDARLNVSGYFAEFINRNNLKLVKYFLE